MSTLLLAAAADVTGEAHYLSLSRLQKVGQISITGTQTVTLQGRIDSAHDWVTIKELSESGLFLFTCPPWLRAVTSGTSGGSSVTSVAW